MTQPADSRLMNEVEFALVMEVMERRRKEVLSDFYKAAHEFAGLVAQHLSQIYGLSMSVHKGWGFTREVDFLYGYGNLRNPLKDLMLEMGLSGAPGFPSGRWNLKVFGHNMVTELFPDDAASCEPIQRIGKDTSICDDGFTGVWAGLSLKSKGGQLTAWAPPRGNPDGYEAINATALFHAMMHEIDRHPEFFPLRRVTPIEPTSPALAKA